VAPENFAGSADIMTYDEALAYANERNKSLRSERDFNNSIAIAHVDGSLFFITNGCFETKEKWIIFYNEHSQPLVFEEEDLDQYHIF
jgi:hypothetical protein